ncbi:MAG: GAF domain-containing sensor histidine kinase [Chloroflexota bacterium]|nr:GAF domain-containing sensor histidine kinase [Chloroflexota bacterium]
MNPISAFLVRYGVLIYFFYGLAFFAMGLALALASRRRSEFRFAQAIVPLAAFGILHGVHEWIVMFQLVAALTSGYAPTVLHEVIRLAFLVVSFLMLLAFGMRLLRPGQTTGGRLLFPLLIVFGIWAAGTVVVTLTLQLSSDDAVGIADVLARYSLGIPAALLGAWALMAQQRTFREHGIPQFGRDLVWAATALLLYGVVGQLFVRETVLFPSSVINSALFLDWFGVPIQLFRGVMAGILAFFMVRTLNAFEVESQRRLEYANEARVEAQSEALVAAQQTGQERERLNAELRNTARELALMLELSNLLASQMEMQARQQAALQRLVRSLDFPEAGLILLINRRTGDFEVQAECCCASADCSARLERARDLGEKCATQKLVLCEHLDGEVLEVSFEQALTEPECHLYASPVTMISLPLFVREQVIGSIVLVQAGAEGYHDLALDELQLILGVTRQLGLSIENARLYSDAQDREQTLGELLHQVVGAQEAERKRIARELHDATAQSLTAIALGLRGVETLLETDGKAGGQLVSQVREIKSFSTDALGELRQIIADLRPPLLDDMGLAPAISWYTEAFEKRLDTPVEFIVEGTPVRLPSEYETVLFRIFQEALTNVAKHAAASSITVVLRFVPTLVCLIVEDDGKGFDVGLLSTGQVPYSGWGLMGIQERSALLGGECAIDSEPDAGTRIWVSIPLLGQEVATTDVEDQASAG